MNANGSFIFDILLFSIGLHFSLYLIYGRITGRPLVGPYQPKAPGYKTFLKLVNNTKYLAITIIVTLFFTLNTVLDVARILRSSSSHSILVVAPLIVVLAFGISIPVLTRILIPRK